MKAIRSLEQHVDSLMAYGFDALSDKELEKELKYPRAIFAATFAMGYPVALDASAEERDTLGFTSMTQYSKLSGCRAYCTLHRKDLRQL